MLAGLTLGAIAAEVEFQAFAHSPWAQVLPAVAAQFDAPDPETGYAHRPNVSGWWLRENRAFVRINAQGLRDRPRTTSPAPGTPRIAVTGDSFTEALQVEEADLFTLRAEQKLSDRGHAVEVLNFGLSGALPLQQLLFVVDRGLPMGIDGVVMNVAADTLPSPMVADDSVVPAYVESASGKLEIGRAYRNRRSHRLAKRWIGRAFFWLVDHSLMANMLYTRAKLGVRVGGPAAAGSPERPRMDRCEQSAALLTATRRLWRDGQPAWAASRLERTLQDTRKWLGDRPVVWAVRSFDIPGVECPAVRELRRETVALVQARLERAGIGFLDLDQALASKLGVSEPFGDMFGFGARIGHGHLNPRGHEIHAQVLADLVEARFLSAEHRRGATPR